MRTPTPTVPLASLRTGSRAAVVRTHSRLERVGCPAMMERLAAMGFVPGVKLTVEANYGTGPVIVAIKGARVAVGRGQAGRLMVEPEEARRTNVLVTPGSEDAEA